MATLWQIQTDAEKAAKCTSDDDVKRLANAVSARVAALEKTLQSTRNLVLTKREAG